MNKDGFEFNGKRYVTSKVMAEIWDMKARNVAEYCRDHMVMGAFKDSSKRWVIPVDAKKPLNKSVIEKVLWLVLQLKNNPSYQIDYSVLDVKSDDIAGTFDYLAALSLIEPFEKCEAAEIPYKALLTQAGMEVIRKAGEASEKGNKKALDKYTIIELLTVFAKIAPHAVTVYQQLGHTPIAPAG